MMTNVKRIGVFNEKRKCLYDDMENICFVWKHNMFASISGILRCVVYYGRSITIYRSIYKNDKNNCYTDLDDEESEAYMKKIEELLEQFEDEKE